MQVYSLLATSTKLCCVLRTFGCIGWMGSLKECLYPFQDIGMKGQRVILKLFVDSIISYQKCSR